MVEVQVVPKEFQMLVYLQMPMLALHEVKREELMKWTDQTKCSG